MRDDIEQLAFLILMHVLYVTSSKRHPALLDYNLSNAVTCLNYSNKFITAQG